MKKIITYSEVPNRKADQNKQAGLEESDTLLAYLLIKLINKQGVVFQFTKYNYKRAGGKIASRVEENLNNLSEHALLLGTSE